MVGVDDAGELASEEVADDAEHGELAGGEGGFAIAEECDDGKTLVVVATGEGEEGGVFDPVGVVAELLDQVSVGGEDGDVLLVLEGWGDAVGHVLEEDFGGIAGAVEVDVGTEGELA